LKPLLKKKTLFREGKKEGEKFRARGADPFSSKKREKDTWKKPSNQKGKEVMDSK